MASRRANSDPYAVLGVPRDADEPTIKQAYRKAAHESHPDRHPDDAAAEERFKRVSAAYAVLSDSERRHNYDEFGELALDPNFAADAAAEAQRNLGSTWQQGFADAAGGFDLGGDPLGDLFARLFGDLRTGPARPVRGRDLATTLEIDFALAAPRRPRQAARAAGSDGGSRLRLRGKGVASAADRPAGDLIATLRIRVPQGLDDAGRAAVAQLSDHEPDDPRASLFD